MDTENTFSDYFNQTKSTASKYAQLVSTIVSDYDVTLIFHQVKPVQAKKEDITDFKSTTEEVSRIIVPHKTIKELQDLLNRLFPTDNVTKKK